MKQSWLLDEPDTREDPPGDPFEKYQLQAEDNLRKALGPELFDYLERMTGEENEGGSEK